MSGNRRKSTTPKPVETAVESVVARVVAIPKEPEPVAANAPVPPPAPKTAPAAKPKPERIGDILRQARLDRNDDLYQIAEYLRIKPGFLIALENSRYDEFPADAYVIGFLRTYANFLGVDGKEAVDRYRYEMAGRRKKPVLLMPTPVSEGRAPTGIVMVGAAVAVLLIYALWYGISSSNRAEVNMPAPLPTAAQPVPAASETGLAAGLTAPVASPASASTSSAIPPAAPGIVVTAAQSPEAAKEEAAAKIASMQQESDKTAKTADAATAARDAKDTNGKQVYGDPATVSRIIIRATQSSWVMVTDSNGKAVFDHVLKPGDVYKVPNKPGLSLTTGNGSGIVLSLDGADLPRVAAGAPHVVRDIPLDPDRLTAATDR